MTEEAQGPPRGEAAWKAEKQRIAANNDAAYARGRKARAAKNAEAQARERAAAKAGVQEPPDAASSHGRAGTRPRAAHRRGDVPPGAPRALPRAGVRVQADQP